MQILANLSHEETTYVYDLIEKSLHWKIWNFVW